MSNFDLFCSLTIFHLEKIAPIKKEISTTLSQIQTIKDATGVYENKAVQLRVNLVFLKDRLFMPLLYQEH
jgi:hypothetical protein